MFTIQTVRGEIAEAENTDFLNFHRCLSRRSFSEPRLE